MATRYVKQAGNQLDPVYRGAIQGVSAQIPQVNNLYEALISGLEGQTAGGIQDVVASAEQRGVGRARLAEDVGATLNTALDLERNRAGAQQAEDVAGITGNLTDLRTGRISARQDLGDTFQDMGLAKAENKLVMSEARKKYLMDILALERQAELDKKAAAIQRQREASAYGGFGSGEASTSGSGGVNPPEEFLSYLQGKGDMRQYSRKTMDKFVNDWFKSKGIKSNKQRQGYWDLRNQYYNINPVPGRG